MLLHLFTPTLSFWLVIGGIFNITGCKIYRVPGCTLPPNAMFPPKQTMAFLSGICGSPPIIPLVSRPWPPLGTVYPSFGPRGGGTLLDVTCLARRRLETRKNRQRKSTCFCFQFHSEKCFPCVFFLVGDFLLMMKNDTSWTGNTEKRTVYLKVWEKFLDALIHVSFEGIWIREYQQTFFPANAEVHVPRDSHTTFNEFSQVRSQFFHHWIWRMRI